MTLLEEVKEILKEDTRFVDSEGNLLKNTIIEYALKLDKDIIKLLLKNDRVKQHFFRDIDGTLVFDKERFMKFIDNKEFLPDSYTSFKNKIGLANEEKKYLAKSKEVVLVWPYKDCVLEGGQEKTDEKRKEIFHNVILAPDEIDRLLEPKVFTNFKRIDKDGEHPLDGFRRDPEINRRRGLPEDTITDNLIIKGNNLLVLHSLLKEFRGKIKLIYIDPPYNTGSDEFKYNDNFNHSTWLTFMKNRLEVAKELLKKDGILAVQCSYHEYAYLKILLDEIFSRNNHLCTFNILVRHPDRILTGDKEFNDVIEYLMFYRVSPETKFPKKIEEKDIDEYIYSVKEIGAPEVIELGGKKVFVYTPDKIVIEKGIPHETKFKKISIRGSIREKNSSGRFYVKYLEELKNKFPPGTVFKVPGIGDDMYKYRYFYLPERGRKNGGYFQGKPTSTDITMKPYPNFYDFHEEYNNVASQGGVSLRNAKKPEELLKFIIEIFTNQYDLVLDFFLGSGTTCAVAHKMGRQYIGIEQLDYGKNSAVVRLKYVIDGNQTGISKEVNWQGGGDFVYMELMKLNEEYVEKIRDAETTENLLNIWVEMKYNGFLSYRIDPRLFDKNIEEFKSLSIDQQKKLLLEMLEYNDLYVNYSDIEDSIHNVSEKDKRLNRDFYEVRNDA
ncbi:MAG: site-specific DNA-methyltransferase [Thermosipho sp. (in: Bacteria)]|nr:site-specific DNA-methyltransferase [Thermosipho sp. (in: thermotogales)]